MSTTDTTRLPRLTVVQEHEHTDYSLQVQADGTLRLLCLGEAVTYVPTPGQYDPKVATCFALFPDRLTAVRFLEYFLIGLVALHEIDHYAQSMVSWQRLRTVDLIDEVH